MSRPIELAGIGVEDLRLPTPQLQLQLRLYDIDSSGILAVAILYLCFLITV